MQGMTKLCWWFTMVYCHLALLAHWTPSLRAEEKRMDEGWRVVIPLSRPAGLRRAFNRLPAEAADTAVSQATVWVENGWLRAERRTAEGDLEWQIVLAEAKDAEPPRIESNDDWGIFRLSFRDGRYVIRDENWSLRAVRQRKTKEKNWTSLVVPPSDPGTEEVPKDPPQIPPANYPAGPAIPAADELPVIFERTINSWQFVAIGPARDAVDCLVRLTHRQLDSERNVHRTIHTIPFGRLVEAHHGDLHSLTDDGEILVARRVEQSLADQELKRLARQADLIGKPPRPFGDGEWLNSDRPLNWDDWRGRAVLLSIQSVRYVGGDGPPRPIDVDPGLDHLRTKYASRGLVVIGMVGGIRAEAQKEEFAQTLTDNDIAWPFKLETDRARAANYEFGNGHPRFVLVGRDGNVASIGAGRWPTATEIEKLLEEE